MLPQQEGVDIRMNPVTKSLPEMRKAAESNGAPAMVQPAAPALLSFRTFHVLLLGLTALLALLVFAEAFRMLRVTGDNMYPESAGVLDAQRWAQGLPLYSDYRQAPYLITHFPPLWYGVLAAAAKLGYGSMDSLELWGRLFSLACLFAAVAMGYRWNRREGLSASLALLAPTFYLSFPILAPWAVTARPDFPGLFFGFLAIYFVAGRASAKSVSLAAVAAAVAILSRHNAVAAPAAIVLWLLWSKRWKHAVLFCGVVGALTIPVLAFFQVSTGMLLLNLSGAKFGPIAFTYMRDVLLRLLTTSGYGVVSILVALGLTGLATSWNQAGGRNMLLGLYLGTACFFAAAGSAAAGAAVNHYIETGFALAVLVPSGVAAMRNGWKAQPALGVFAAATVVVLLAPALDLQRWNAMHFQREDFRRVLPVMDQKLVFTDIPYLAARTRSAQALDLVSLTYTERKPGRAAWSSASLVSEFQNRNYELVILNERADEPYDPAALYPRYPRLDGNVLAAIRQNYGLCFELDGSFIYGRLSGAGPNAGNSCPAPIAGSKAAPAGAAGLSPM
jgi:hypothetical protein